MTPGTVLGRRRCARGHRWRRRTCGLGSALFAVPTQLPTGAESRGTGDDGAFHEVEDVDHWLSSPRRVETFGPIGITVRTLTDPAGTNRVGLIVDVPDMNAFQELTQSETVAEAMRFDGVRPETLLLLVES